MTFELVLSESDFLTHQLFIASTSSRIKKRRTRTRISYSIIFGMLGYLFFLMGNQVMGYYFVIAGLITLVFAPFYLRGVYKRHYQNYIKEHFQGRINRPSTISFEEDQIITEDKNIYSKIKVEALEMIDEIEDHFFLKLETGTTLILPKLLIHKYPGVLQIIKQWAEEFSIPYQQQLNWKWQ